MKRYMYQIFSTILTLFAASAVYAQSTIESMNQNADQSQGMYQPMNMEYAGIGPIGMVQSAWLDPLQNLGEGQTKPAYSKYYWSPDLVLPVRLREGMITLVNFPEWELIESIYIGDENTFKGEISGPNTLLLYPKPGSMVGVDTNIIVFGRSGNKYVFYARSEGVNTERLTNSIIDIEIIDAQKNGQSAGGSGSAGGGSRVTAGSTGSKNVDSTFTKRFQKDDWIKSIPVDPSKFKFDIEVYVPNPDDVIIAPERVWRDDIFTYVDLGEKALSMIQRPIVTLVVERMETPVGFRTKGPNNRLIIVEGVGDMVLRNGKRIVCLKLRRSDEAGIYDIQTEENGWDVPPAIPSGSASTTSGTTNSVVQGFGPSAADTSNGASGNVTEGVNNPALSGEYAMRVGANGELIMPQYATGLPNGSSPNGASYGTAGMSYGTTGAQATGATAQMFSGYQFGTGFDGEDTANISVELGTDADVNNLENLWSEISKKYSSVVKGYQPFYSVDAPADGQGKELFHLRIGPVKSIESGDKICSQLGRNGVFCSVVRVQ